MGYRLKKRSGLKGITRHCQQISQLLKALSHPGRLLIMGSLVEGPKTVTELQEECGLSQSQLSQFLCRMKLEKLVKCRREGRFQFYQAANSDVVDLIRSIQRIYC
jgi:DNA-binding transcriptional ArsR family regulator